MQFLMEHWASVLGVALVALILSTLIPWGKLMPAFKWPTIGTTKAPVDKPTYADASTALSTLAKYKANCKEAPEYAMVMASLKTVEAT